MDNTFILVKRSGVWHYRTYDERGIRRRFSTGKKNKMAANAYCMELARMGTLIPSSNTPITFADFSAPFWVWETCPIVTDIIIREGHFSPALCRNNRGSMTKNILPTFGSKLLTEITPAQVNRWLLGLRTGGLSANTANKMLSMLRRMLEVAIDQERLEKNPAGRVKRLVEKPEARVAYTTKEASRILGGAPWADELGYLASLLAANTGMRMGEIRALQPSDIKPDRIIVSHSWTDTVGLKCTKGDKVREIPITRELYGALMAFAPDQIAGFIFSNDGGISPCCSESIRDPLYERIESLGIIRRPGMTFHSWRHFFNTRLIAAGVQGELTRAVVGHEDAKMTDRYLHLKASDLGVIGAVQGEIIRLIH